MLEGFALVPILLFSVIIHEMAHGYMALKLGDSTAKDQGRLTFNPIPHIDPIGSVLVPLASYLAVGSVFIAWAKPVPVNPANFKNLRRDDILVSVVGPLSNLVVAFLCTIGYVLVLQVIPAEGDSVSYVEQSTFFMSDMMLMGITLNIYLAVFNMLPVPPLDGSHVVASLLPPALGEQYRRIGFFGIIIILVIMRVDAVRELVQSLVYILLIPYQMFIQLFGG